MRPANFSLRANLCMWFQHRCVEETQFLRHILLNDECRFTWDAVLNSRNSHVWDDENRHSHHAHGIQECFGINMWAGIVDGLPPSLIGNT